MIKPLFLSDIPTAAACECQAHSLVHLSMGTHASSIPGSYPTLQPPTRATSLIPPIMRLLAHWSEQLLGFPALESTDSYS